MGHNRPGCNNDGHHMITEHHINIHKLQHTEVLLADDENTLQCSNSQTDNHAIALTVSTVTAVIQ